MRITDLKPGMKCYYYGECSVVVVEVVRSNPEEGIYYPYAMVQRDDTGGVFQANASSLTSVEVIEERRRQRDQRAAEVARVCARLQEFLPSLSGRNYYGDEGIEVTFSEEDALKILQVYEAKLPKDNQLPSSYNLGNEDERRAGKRRAVLLSQRVRRTVGEGWCSKWHFPREWGEDGMVELRMFLYDDTVHSLLDRLNGRQDRGSALAQLFG